MKTTVIGGASTQSRTRRPGNPLTTARAEGVLEYTPNGRPILSWVMGQYGPLLGFPTGYKRGPTGYLCSSLSRAILGGQAALGSYPPSCEQKLAERLGTLYAPYLRDDDIGVRFFSNGTDACQAAVALSRYATGSQWFVSVGYHGGSSPTFTFPPQNEGVPNDGTRFDYTFDNGAENYDCNDIACEIVEVPSIEDEHLAVPTLRHIQSMCISDGAYFILDDIVTGFRYAPAGALEYYSGLAGDTLRADFICVGKALSTFGKVAALLGPCSIMEALTDRVFASHTFNDHPFGLMDSLLTLDEYHKHGESLYQHIAEVGTALRDGLNTMFAETDFPAQCIGHPARSVIMTDDPRRLRAVLGRLVNEYGILVDRPNFVVLPHTLEHVERTLIAMRAVIETESGPETES